MRVPGLAGRRKIVAFSLLCPINSMAVFISNMKWGERFLALGRSRRNRGNYTATGSPVIFRRKVSPPL